MKPKTLAAIELMTIALFLALFLWWTYPRNLSTSDLVAVSTTTLALPAFPNVSIEAESAFVYDAHDHKVLFAKNAEERRPLASLTKLMSALVASDLVPNYVTVRISPDDIREEGDTGLFVDEQWNVDKLLDYSLVTSSNDGIHAVAAVAGGQISSTSTVPLDLFVQKMNETAQKIGLKESIFINQSGLDISKIQSGGYGSAHDIALLVDYILENKPHLLEATSLSKTMISSETIVHNAVNTDKSILDIPNVIASKTGYTDLSGGNVVVAFSVGLNHPVIISVLGSSYDGRFKDLTTLADAVISYFNNDIKTIKIPFK